MIFLTCKLSVFFLKSKLTILVLVCRKRVQLENKDKLIVSMVGPTVLGRNEELCQILINKITLIAMVL
jgi:hypothetical protein